ncbi:MAG: M81 family metallopeptidase [Alphaproteobacteria bacterium]|nr:M81 family metallopeptidase [Alphaproteobacteria bacterium]
MRIAVGGFLHETNTFAQNGAGYADFADADGWPALSQSGALVAAVAGMNLAISGFLEAARAAGDSVAPLLWCSAVPSAEVEEEAFERISAMLLDALSEAGLVDAVYLDLHGAMVTAHLEDGEGELLARVRGAIGTAIPLVASLDLHANVTPRMVAESDALVTYRTYPHVDMAETGARTHAVLARMAAGRRPAKALRKADYLMPLVWQCTDMAPAKDLASRCDALATGEGVWSASLASGFPPADIFECGPAVLAYADSQSAADAAADALAAAVAEAEPDFAGRIYSPQEAAALATSPPRRPLVIADTQDNAGAGAASDTVGMLRALLAAGVEDAVFGLLYDPPAAAAAHAAGIGSTISVSLGAGSAWEGERPLSVNVEVQALGDGDFTATGPMFGGSHMQLGPMAAIRIGGVTVVVSSRRMQAADQAMFRHLGIEPADHAALVLKSSVHFRADFTPIAGEIIVVASPGPNPVDHLALDYRRLRPGLRLVPLGPAHGD